MRGGVSLAVENLSELERQVLVERHLVSMELCESDAAGVILSPDFSVSIMVNEEDHLRMQVLLLGSVKETWDQMAEIDTALKGSRFCFFRTCWISDCLPN